MHLRGAVLRGGLLFVSRPGVEFTSWEAALAWAPGYCHVHLPYLHRAPPKGQRYLIRRRAHWRA
jgi:hypothetical protein